MAEIKGVLIKEGNRLNDLISNYEAKLQNLSRGTIFIRKMGNSHFVYRKYKENNKTKTVYLGPRGSDKAKQGILESKEYKRISKQIRIEKVNYEEVLKVIKAYNKKSGSFIDKTVKIEFKPSKTMQKLIKKAENADVLENYGLYMNYAYAIDSQAKKETTQHLLSESQWNKLIRRYCL